MIEFKNVYEHAPGTVRVRSLEHWNVTLLSDGAHLTGFVKEGENERPLAEGATHRFTRTSLIKSVKGRTVTTISGSTYQLVGDPEVSYKEGLIRSGFAYNDEEPLASIRLFQY